MIESYGMTITAEVLDRYAAYQQAAGLSEGTIRLRRYELGRLARIGELLALTPDQLVAYLASPGWSPEYRKSIRAAIRSFYTWATDVAELLERDPSRKLPRVRVPKALPRPAPPDRVASALRSARSDDQRLMILLARLEGMRRAEIATLHSDWIEGASIRVRGKGGVTRLVPLHPDVARMLTGRPDGWVFAGRVNGHVSPGWVGKILARCLGEGYSGHTLRHAAASGWYAVERDLLAVSRLLGHSSVLTTQTYTAVPDDAARAAVLGSAA